MRKEFIRGEVKFYCYSIMTGIKLFLLFLLLTFRFGFENISAQSEAAYLTANAVLIDNPEKLSDGVYQLLSPFQVIMFGEMHGTNESAPFINGLAGLFTDKGDSVLVGLEIPSGLMAKFERLRTDSSVYESDFFRISALSGRESLPWAMLISSMNKNGKVKLFFYDVNDKEGKEYNRDSLMFAKIKAQMKEHPIWKVITLSGNYHNRLSDELTMAYYLKKDTELSIASKMCTLNMEYKEGTCMANFGHGLELKMLGAYPSVYNSTEGYDRYLILNPPSYYSPYTGFYYTKSITPATMTNTK